MAVTLQDLLPASFTAFAQVHKVPGRGWRAARAVLPCRTAALGGHVRRCPEGHGTEIWSNSCRYRACPRGGQQRSSQWLESWQQQVLPPAHFHVVFTLPSELHALWQWNRQVLTEALFRCVHETLFPLLGAAQWLGAKPGVLAALHPWGRPLSVPPHGHCVVTGGGLGSEGSWRAVTNGYLLPVAVVRAVFRGQVLSEFEALWTSGQLVMPPHLNDEGVRGMLIEAARKKWNVRIAERYAHGRGVAKSLARYGRGGPIKDQRLVTFDGQPVTFRYGTHRQLDDRGKPQHQELRLRVAEFLQRWSEHVPLPGVQGVRAWGL